MSHAPSLPPVLVTGATGRHGGTGLAVVRKLREAGRPVRVMARSLSKRTEALAALGAEIALGDFTDRASLVAALRGAEAATFTDPGAGGVVEAAATFAAAIRGLGTSPRVVVTSMAPAHPQSPSHLGRAQWLAEEVLAWAGLDLCVLRISALFFENIATLHAASIREHGLLRNSFGAAKLGWISGEDAGALVAAALLHPERFAGQAIHHPPGAELLDHAQIAALLSEALEKPVRFEPASREAWQQELIALADSDPGGPVNHDMAGHISTLGAALSAPGRALARMPDAAELRRLIGTEPMRFADHVRQQRALFTPVR